MTEDFTRLTASSGDRATAPAGGSAQPMTRREARAAEAPLSRRALREAEAAQAAARRSRRGVVPRPPAGPVATTPATTAVTPTVPLRKRVARKVFPPIVMAAAAALIVGTSVPSSVLGDPNAPAATASLGTVASALDAGAVIESGASRSASDAPEAQVLAATSDDASALPVASRDDWSVTSYAEMMRLRYGNRTFAYATTGAGAVRWPFPFAAPISSGFGSRAAPCWGCSSYHQGLDFVPGYGTPIQAIAGGTVTLSQQGGGFGNHVHIDHVINGQRVTSVYAHMIWDSSPLRVGDTIEAGDFVGLVGSSGISTAPHLHFELHLDGVPVDPYAWLVTNAS
ncbi:M23 family metallopeptidase [Microcella sp.]|uniref:M23 family metallopeptidase n=1 Tax=Microcella sp. TaxID=1913979 RepID=UPI00391D99D5